MNRYHTSFSPTAVETVTIDSYGTVVDPFSVEETLAEYVEQVRSIATQWRSRSIMYIMVGNFTDRYQTFYEMNRDALRFAL